MAPTSFPLLRSGPVRDARRDIQAGLVLAAFLVPVGMGYAQASGVAPVYGLYATVTTLVVYAFLGPSPVFVLGPDSSLAPLIAATVLPLAAGDPDRAILLASALAIGSGAICVVAGLARFGFLSELLSTPVRMGYLNGIAIAVTLSQLPILTATESTHDQPLGAALDAFDAVISGDADHRGLALGMVALAALLFQRRVNPRFPGVLMVVVAATAYVGATGRGDLSVVGTLPSGFPVPTAPMIGTGDIAALAVGSFTIAVVTFADTGVLAKAYASRRGVDGDTDQELVALGSANMAAGLFAGFPVSASSSRTPVAEAAGATSQLTGLVASGAIVVVLLALPELFTDLPLAALSAVVVVAVLGLVEVRGVARLLRHRPSECWLSIATTVGVVVLGALWGIALAVAISLVAFIERSRRPHTTVLVKERGTRGYHDIERHPEGTPVEGMLLYRFDAPLFFANAAHFRDDVLGRISAERRPIHTVIVTAEPITNIDATADDMLRSLAEELHTRGVQLALAELKGVVRDELAASGTAERIGLHHFHPTIERAIEVEQRAAHRRQRNQDVGP